MLSRFCGFFFPLYRCHHCGKPASVIFHEHEREHVAELVREGQVVLDELRTALQGAQHLAATLQALNAAAELASAVATEDAAD